MTSGEVLHVSEAGNSTINHKIHFSFRTKLANHSGTSAQKMSKMLNILFTQSELKVKIQFFKADRNYTGKSLGHCVQAALRHFLRALHK